MMQDDSDYFSKHLPQSEYRITKSTGRKSPVVMNLELEKIPLLKQTDKKNIRDRIEEQMDHLVLTLIGDGGVDDEWRAKTLHHIYAQLGI